MRFERVCGDPGVIAPDIVQQHVASDDLVAGAQQELDDRRFLLGQPDLAVVLAHEQFRRRLEGVGPDLEHRVLAVLVLAQVGADARQQHGEAERAVLGESDQVPAAAERVGREPLRPAGVADQVLHQPRLREPREGLEEVIAPDLDVRRHQVRDARVHAARVEVLRGRLEDAWLSSLEHDRAPVADVQDGLLAIPREDAAELIVKARGVLEAEAKTIQAMKEGRWDRSFIDALEARCNN
mgnify:CR=1 FL=1